MKKINTIILVLVLIFIFSLTLNAADSNLLLSEDKSLYVVTKKFSRNNDVARLLKLNLSSKQYYELDHFHFVYDTIHTDYYHDYNFVTIECYKNQKSFKSGMYDFYIIPMSKPWKMDVGKMGGYAWQFPYQDKNQNYLIDYTVYMSINNIKTFERKDYKLEEEQGMKIMENVTYQGFSVENNKLRYKPSHFLSEVNFRYPPPKEMLEGLDDIFLFCNTDRYVAFREGIKDFTKLIILDKKTDEWKEYKLEGKETEVKKMGNFVVGRMENSRFDTLRNFVFFNFATREKQKIKLPKPTKILYVAEKYVIAKAKDKLLYLPIVNNEVKVDKAKTLYNDEYIVNQIDGAFLGPKKIPEKIKVKKAREYNKLAEEHYKKSVGIHMSRAAYYFKQATLLDPDYAQAYSNLGLAYLELRKYERSIQASKKAIEVTDKELIKASSHYNLAQVYEKQKKWEKALKHYEKALKYKEHSAYKEGIKRMEDKIKRTTQATKLNSKGEKYYQQNKFKKAVEYYNRAIEAYSENAKIHSNLGLAYYKLDKLDKSIRFSKSAVNLADDKTIKASSYYNLGKVYEEQEDWRQAFSNYNLALEIVEDSTYKQAIKRVNKKADTEYKKITFPDSTFEKIIRKKLSIDNEVILKRDVENIKELSYKHYDDRPPFKELESLEGIQHLTNLKKLEIVFCKVKDISPLSELTKLEELDLAHNKIENIKPLANLTNLRELDLYKNSIKDISALFSLIKLKELNLTKNRIEEGIDGLSDLTRLEKLYLNENRIKEIDSLADLTRLEELHLRENKIQNISALSNLTKLEELHLQKNNIKNVDALSNLIKLKELYMQENKIEEISALSNLTKLKELKLGHNRIEDISSLSKLRNLTRFYINDNQIKDVSLLLELDKLKVVKLTGNDGIDISKGSKTYKIMKKLDERGVSIKDYHTKL